MPIMLVCLLKTACNDNLFDFYFMITGCFDVCDQNLIIIISEILFNCEHTND